MKIDMLSDGLKIDTIDDKKLKGYQYDSLVFRYIIARKQMAEYERLKFFRKYYPGIPKNLKSKK